MAKKKSSLSYDSDEITRITLKNNKEIVESNLEVASSVDQIIKKYSQRDIVCEKKAAIWKRAINGLKNSWEEATNMVKYYSDGLVSKNMEKQLPREKRDAVSNTNKILEPIFKLGLAQDATNLIGKVAKPIQNDYKIGTAVDGVSFHSIDSWTKFYDEIKAARIKDLIGLSADDRSKKEIEFQQFDASMTLEFERYNKLISSRNKYDKTRESESANINWWGNLFTQKLSPMYPLILHKKEEESINFHYDNYRKYLKGQDVNDLWLERYPHNLPEAVVFGKAPNKYKKQNRNTTANPSISAIEPLQKHNLDSIDFETQLLNQVEGSQAVLAKHISDVNTKLASMFQVQQTMFTSDLEKKLIDIDSYYTQEIAKIEGNETAISELKTKHKAARDEASKTHMKSIDDSEKLELERLQGMQSIGMTELVEEQKFEITRKYIEKRIEAQKALVSTGNETAKVQVDILEASLKNLELKKPAQSLKALADKALFNTIQKGFEKIDQSTEDSTQKTENAKAKTIGLFSTITGNAGQVSAVVKDLKSAFGGMDEGLDMVLETVGNIAAGFATGGMVGGIMAVVSEGFSLLGKAKDAEKRHQAALKAISTSRITQQREYNLLLMEQNLLMKEATTIFGEKQISKAAKSVLVYQQALQDMNKEIKGTEPKFPSLSSILKGGLKDYTKQLDAYNKGIGALYNAQIVTGHKKSGLFGWGKGKDTYSSIVDVYGYDELIDKEGKLNVERVKTIISTQKMSDETKSYLQNLIDLQEKAEKAEEALESYLQTTFGSLGTDLMKSITDALRSDGVNAWEEFGKAGAGVLEKLGEQLAYELFFADKFEALQNDLKKVYSDTESISNPEERSKEIAKKQMAVVGSFYGSIGTEMEAAQVFLEEWKNNGKNQGFSMWSSAEATTRQGATGSGITSMSENTASELNGSFYAIRQQVGDITNISRESLLIQRTMQTQLTRVADNTEYCRYLENVKNSLEDIQTRGVRIKD